MTGFFPAISVGCAVPRDGFEGAVHSVFRSAVNLRVPGETLLLTLLLSEGPNLPQGIRLDTPDGLVFRGLSPGDRAWCIDDKLIVGDSFVVDLRTGSNWACDLPSLSVDMTRRAVAAAWHDALEALQERQARSGSGAAASDNPNGCHMHQSALARQIHTLLHSMLTATSKFDVTGMEELRGLVGLGAGLTPSGDDLLMGYMAGLWCTTRSRQERLAFLQHVAESLVRHSTRTNDIARTYLLLAARGQFSSLLVELAAAIGSDADATGVRGRTNAAMRLGHSSGMEAVNGLLLGLAAWDAPHLALAPATLGIY